MAHDMSSECRNEYVQDQWTTRWYHGMQHSTTTPTTTITSSQPPDGTMCVDDCNILVSAVVT